jgi:NADPH:quinone reductase-like Zn-dependent oxidoreductase
MAAIPSRQSTMRALAICGVDVPKLQPGNHSFARIEVNAVPVTCGIVETTRPAFDAEAPENCHHVLVHVEAFSCNYRDRALVLWAARSSPPNRFYAIGSEFAGVVVAVGTGVSRVRVGDQVIGDNHYAPPAAGRPSAPARPGIPTNQASHEYLVLREEKVQTVPRSMPTPIAAAFSVGAQTTYSMVRKLDLASGSPVLVTGATSNTSLFAIRALKAAGMMVYAATTSTTFDDALRQVGADEVFHVDLRAPSFTEHEQIRTAVRTVGGFAGCIDPYFDLYLTRIVGLLAPGGRYVTCGFFDQHLAITREPFPGHAPDYGAVMQLAMVRNISLIGNCVGTSADLQRAVGDYAAGRLDVAIDRTYTDGDAAPFVARTFTDRTRLGKVVYQYA